MPETSKRLYEVGCQFEPGVTSWPEGPGLRVTPDGWVITVGFHRPGPEQVVNARSGYLQFAWVAGERVALLCFKLGVNPWSDCPYDLHRQEPGELAVAARWDPSRARRVTIFLIDAADGVIQVIRAAGLPIRFASAMADSLTRQLGLSPDEAASDAEISALYGARPDEGAKGARPQPVRTSKQLALEHAAVACYIPPAGNKAPPG